MTKEEIEKKKTKYNDKGGRKENEKKRMKGGGGKRGEVFRLRISILDIQAR